MPIACVKKAEELVSITLPDDGDDTIPFGELVKKVLTLEPYLGALICEITHPDNAREVPDSLKKHFEKGGFYFEINELMLKAEGVINRIMYDRKRFWDESRPSPSESREDSFKRHIEAVLKREDPRINLQFLTKVAPFLRPALEPFFSGDTFQDPQKKMWNAVKKKEDLPEEGAGSPDSLGLLALFPPEGEPIRIEQGRVGNCALLASLDAMLHSDDGRKLIASMFHYTDTGSLEVRIKTNRYTHHLLEKMDMGQLEGKYEFRQESGYDVFTISPERLRDINRTSSHGVTSNALIVKVLERVSSYYYSTPLGVDSVMAHNERGKFTTSDIDFMSQLFGGINIHHIPIQPGEGFEEAAENLMERSKINPIYVTMDFSHMVKGDSTKHSRHALRIESVEKDSTGQWIITLINPWDTSKPVSYSLTELLSKYRAEFSVFHVDKISKPTNKQSEEILSYLHQKPAPPPLPVPVHHVGGGGGGGGRSHSDEVLVAVKAVYELQQS
ncbi:MAG: hypothetical protein NTW94_01200 [Legionellales bacterium]|nr:hypothetical protein [Legionellales bacterium]